MNPEKFGALTIGVILLVIAFLLLSKSKQIKSTKFLLVGNGISLVSYALQS